MREIMKNRELSHFDIAEAKKAYAEGKNITELLCAQKNIHTNTPEIIETAYDLQAGTYIEYANNQFEKISLYTTELAQILDEHINSDDTLLDIGTGELTTLSLLVSALTNKPKDVYAFDISWSRIYKGIAFAKDKMGDDFKRVKTFVADISEIPLFDKSINITTSSHALEPNGGKLNELLTELFRVTADKLVLFEPCYEINTQEGKDRMDKLGYIKNVESVVSELGGKVIDKIVIKTSDLVNHPLNPTVCYVIKPPSTLIQRTTIAEEGFTVPGTNFPLHQIDTYYVSSQIGLCYPILKNIPVLKSNCSILATSLTD
jgi:ubiquinone/menaquinone biosynthesis C-methylase UbiE